MKKSDIDQPPCYFDKYLGLVADTALEQVFADSLRELEALDLESLSAVGGRVYAAGRWTVKDTFQHLADAEQIMAYRALRIGRGDRTALSGFDEALLAAGVSTENRSLAEIIEQLKIVRRASALLFQTFSDEALRRAGEVSGNRMSVLAYGFAIAGHQKHHLQIIDEKYLPLIAESKTAN